VPRANSVKLGGAQGATLRRLGPAFAVAAVLGLPSLAPLPTAGSTLDVGYGYAYGYGSVNNCGVKGSGFHDHGKVCPNRPFPGKGVDKSSASDKTDSDVGDTSTVAATTTSTSADNTTSTVTEDVQSAGKSHGKGNGHGHGKGHGKGN